MGVSDSAIGFLPNSQWHVHSGPPGMLAIIPEPWDNVVLSILNIELFINAF